MCNFLVCCTYSHLIIVDLLLITMLFSSRIIISLQPHYFHYTIFCTRTYQNMFLINFVTTKEMNILNLGCLHPVACVRSR
jgi:hypothetical protein